jgi:undecaprenyl diphosphate synthase
LSPDTVEILIAATEVDRLPRSIPQHIAVICDGNGRWARARGLDRSEGHRAGTENTRRVVEWCRDLGVKYVSLYVFSTENWRRPKSEVEVLMNLIVEGTVKANEDLAQSGVQIRVLGDLTGLPEVVRKAVDHVTRTTAGNRQIVVNLLLNYGGRADIVRACRSLAAECAAGSLSPDEIDEQAVAGRLHTAGSPDPDLIIRTAGDLRLSNFLLWQSAYSELHFSPVCWPDFSRAHLLSAIDDFSRRGRRFGGLNPEVGLGCSARES